MDAPTNEQGYMPAPTTEQGWVNVLGVPDAMSGYATMPYPQGGGGWNLGTQPPVDTEGDFDFGLGSDTSKSSFVLSKHIPMSQAWILRPSGLSRAKYVSGVRGTVIHGPRWLDLVESITSSRLWFTEDISPCPRQRF